MAVFRKLTRPSGRRGQTLIELLVSMSILSVLLFGVSLIYFSSLKAYARTAWKLPPYDEATMGVQEVSRRLREAMLVADCGDNYVVVVMPKKDSNGDNILINVDGELRLVQGNQMRYYLSDSTGTIGHEGHDLWMALQPYGTVGFTPKKMIAENIHPDLNPTDPVTDQPQALFKYYPDETRLWGIEVMLTSIATVHGQSKTQTADSEVYLRNL
jgi:prepilin-type N-terminal cleavage/methylation domain-containing protein